MPLKEIVFTGQNLESIAAWVLVGMTIVQVTPIKLNPWSWIAKHLGRAINGEVLEKLKEMNEDLAKEKRERQEDKASNMRWFLLSFAESCRKGEIHDKEQWSYVMNKAREYEKYCRDHDITNGVIEEDVKYLRGLYGMLSKEGKI